jgi:hypothetical protein
MREKNQMTSAWAMHIRSTSEEEPEKLVRLLAGAILSCGGWVLSRAATDDGHVRILFEFERGDCLDIYTSMIAAGLDLPAAAHIQLTELCQCTREQIKVCGTEIASIDLDVEIHQLLLKNERTSRWERA